MTKTLIFAHRGSSGTRPENTMPAFEEAVRSGADGIEFDVQMTSDGELVVIHDENVDRTTNGKGKIIDHSLTQLRKLDAGSWFSPAFGKEPIPTLDEVLSFLRHIPIQINIELKNDRIEYQGIEQKMIAKVREYGINDRVILSSFNHKSVALLHQLAPETETAILVMHGWIDPKRRGAAGIHCPINLSLKPIAREAMLKGIAVRAFTANEEEDIAQICRHNVSAVFSDFPEKAVKIRNDFAYHK